MKTLIKKITYTDFKMVEYDSKKGGLTYETIQVNRFRLYAVLIKIQAKLLFYRVKTLFKLG